MFEALPNRNNADGAKQFFPHYLVCGDVEKIADGAKQFFSHHLV